MKKSFTTYEIKPKKFGKFGEKNTHRQTLTPHLPQKDLPGRSQKPIPVTDN